MTNELRASVLVLAVLVVCRWAGAQEVEKPEQSSDAPQVRVGAKAFTESLVLGEIIRLMAKNAGAQTPPLQQFSGTSIVFGALNSGDIDVYAEYTGTISQEILSGEDVTTPEAMRERLAEQGILMSKPLGFNNTYALGMLDSRAEKLGIRTISDLKQHPNLVLGFSSEFLDRSDGWIPLKKDYGLPQTDVLGMEHALTYDALTTGGIDVTDLYSTDAKIERFHIRILEDDRHFFPEYQAVLLYREELVERAPHVVQELLKLEGTLPAKKMISLNAAVELDAENRQRVAAEFLKEQFEVDVATDQTSTWQRFWRYTRQHLFMVTVSLAGAVIVAVPLGIVSAKRPRLGQGVLATVGVVQTIPALALLALLMVPLDYIGVRSVGATPAIIALFLYSLLPIVRNTYTAIHDIPTHLRESAEALGLGAMARLRLIELPLASRTILAGIKTSAVINVGFATLGALIGAGGYGQPIITGLTLKRNDLILQGALAAAALALLVQGLFELAELYLVPRGLRIKRTSN